MLALLSLVFGIVACFCAKTAFAAGATTTVTCKEQLWTFNEAGQSPCLVAAALEAACNGGTWQISPLLDPTTTQYAGPLQGQSNKCVCSSVVYSLVSACGSCQGSAAITWSQWTKNCTSTDITVAGYPLTLPSNIGVPHWAFLNVTKNDIWDINAAQSAGDTPETSAAGPQATGNSGSPDKSESHKSTNVGAIAGGVVGGVIFLALVGLGAFYFLRWRKDRVPPSAQFTKPHTSEKFDLAASPAPYPRTAMTPALPMQTEPPKLYDPSDPSTFPASPAPSYPSYPSGSPFQGSTAHGSDSMYSGGYTSPVPLLHSHNGSTNTGRYAGIPEV